ncbi:MAG TPA: RNA polymerase sigma factor [Acidobacteriaceae bacterium]|jgi:RNA polymerase sigma-70 factor (ECF subfamily)|nr:RNA polymerase sigma factor [Acidobacteriaceae bacterium]
MLEYDGTWAEAVTTDTQRIARGLRQRDIALLHGLVEQYQFRLVRYLIYLLGRRDSVDDLVQETWLHVLERGSSYNGRSRFEPWLFTIARNLTIDHMRKRRIFSLDSTPDSGYQPDQHREPPSLASSAPSPFELAARTEEAHRIAHTLETLEPIYREALVLRFQEELSLQEMSAVMGVPLTTVSSRIYRGLAILRAQMEGEEHAS